MELDIPTTFGSVSFIQGPARFLCYLWQAACSTTSRTPSGMHFCSVVSVLLDSAVGVGACDALVPAAGKCIC
eukprot:612159-Pelagomonas_calceolata.AAC.2